MAEIFRAPNGGLIRSWAASIEPQALAQLNNTAQLPFLHPRGIAVMPDVHMGIGATVGSVVPTEGVLVPAAVGVDIGCGMNAVRTSLCAEDLPDTLNRLRGAIERNVPTGFGGNGDHKPDVTVQRYTAVPPPDHKLLVTLSNALYKGDAIALLKKAASQLGTLGSGNHFIEICLDEEKRVWVVLHSGSRGIGNAIGRHFIGLAKREMERWHIHLPDADLAYLPEGSEHFDNYRQAVAWAQDYALENRRQMMAATLAAIQHELKRPFMIDGEAINCHHNYVAQENHFGRNVYVTRKGAIRAREGDLGIIPGSMGQRSYIVRGKGNPESYCSCSHGAGRVMSRTEAKRTFTVADLVAQTEGVECRKDAGVVDEIPGAYKNIDEVMAQQADLVEVLHVLKQVVCVKGQ